MKANEVTKIRYTRATSYGDGETGEVTERVIIPTFVPLPNIKAIDVTELAVELQEDVAALFREYAEYYRQRAETIFNFEDWLRHTRGPTVKVNPLKWRTFKLENVEVLEE